MINRRLFRTNDKWSPSYIRDFPKWWEHILAGLLLGVGIALGLWWGI